MSTTEEIRKILQDRIVVRQSSTEQRLTQEQQCGLCGTAFRLAGSFCLAIKDEGIICYSCGRKFAPDKIHHVVDTQSAKGAGVDCALPNTAKIDSATWQKLMAELEQLSVVTDELARGMARGIVEAPTGHIGLLHYLKDIPKPPRKEGEQEKDYNLRVKTYRMTRLTEKIHAETTGRVAAVVAMLRTCGVPEYVE